MRRAPRSRTGAQSPSRSCWRPSCRGSTRRSPMSRCRTCKAAFPPRRTRSAWVVTSYIVAAAIMTPLTGWLAGRFGIKYVFLHLGRRVHRGFGLVRRGNEPCPNGDLSAAAGCLRGGARPAVAIGAAADQPASPSCPGDVGLGHGRHIGPDHRPGARRLADRPVQLALGVLHQRAGRGSRRRRHPDLHPRDASRPPRGVRLLWLCHIELGDRRLADAARPRRAQGLVRLARDLCRGDDLRARPLPVHRAHRDGNRPVIPQPRSVEGHQLHHRHDTDVPHRHPALRDHDVICRRCCRIC